MQITLTLQNQKFGDMTGKGEEIYVGDSYYEIEGDYVCEDDIDEYLKETYLTTSLKIAGE